MKSVVAAIALLSTGLAAAGVGSVTSGVTHWSDLKPHHVAGHTERQLLNGSTTALARLDVRGITIDANHATDSVIVAHKDDEVMLIVKDGVISVTLEGRRRLIGPGSIALSLPGDALVVSNPGAAPATYYQFAYRSRAPMDITRGRNAGGSFVVDWNDVPVEKTPTGYRRQPFDRPTAMYRRFEVHVSTLNPGLMNHAPHTHTAEEFVLMRSGDVRMFISTPRHDASAGDLIFLASSVLHGGENLTSVPTEYFAMQGQ